MAAMSWWRIWSDDMREAWNNASGVGGAIGRAMAIVMFVVAGFAFIAAAAAILWLFGRLVGIL
jgi:hypothetical protein